MGVKVHLCNSEIRYYKLYRRYLIEDCGLKMYLTVEATRIPFLVFLGAILDCLGFYRNC